MAQTAVTTTSTIDNKKEPVHSVISMNFEDEWEPRDNLKLEF